jgi:hypothetical protein
VRSLQKTGRNNFEESVLAVSQTGKDGGPVEPEYTPLEMARRIAFILELGRRELKGHVLLKPAKYPTNEMNLRLRS